MKFIIMKCNKQSGIESFFLGGDQSKAAWGPPKHTIRFETEEDAKNTVAQLPVAEFEEVTVCKESSK